MRGSNVCFGGTKWAGNPRRLSAANPLKRSRRAPRNTSKLTYGIIHAAKNLQSTSSTRLAPTAASRRQPNARLFSFSPACKREVRDDKRATRAARLRCRGTVGGIRHRWLVSSPLSNALLKSHLNANYFGQFINYGSTPCRRFSTTCS